MLATNSIFTSTVASIALGQLSIVQTLFDKSQTFPGAFQINQQSPDGYTALMFAAYWGQEEIVSYLLSLPSVDVNLTSTTGETAMSLARQQGHMKIVMKLRDVGATR